VKVVFFGTPSFAVKPLEAILASRHEVVGVVCQPDRLGSRNKVVVSTLKQLAQSHGLPVFQYEKISREGVGDLTALAPDIMVTCAYGQMLSQKVLDIAPHGIINVHGSLLPVLRGAAPIQFAIIDGLRKTGITILQTVYKMDAGDIILQESLDIEPDETSGELFERMSVLGAKLIVEALDLIESNAATFTPQDEEKVTLSKKITPELECINWQDSAEKVHNLVRGLNPTPVAWTTWNGVRLKIYKTMISDISHNSECGTVIATTKKSVSVACGDGTALNIVELQLENGKRMDIASFLCGKKLPVGTKFGV
jgi:methionyl-tRNA formyltransferase